MWAMKIALVQFAAGPNTAENASRAARDLGEAADNGAELVIFPEATAQAFGTGRLDLQAERLDGNFAATLHAAAADRGVTVIAGMFEPADQNGEVNRVYNTALIAGRTRGAYRKMHTYDAFNFAESDTVRPGSRQLVVEIAGLKVGLAICFDLRFPALFQDLARAGAQIIAVPTSWAHGAGKLRQLRTLVSARALDSGAYVAMCDMARPEDLDPHDSAPRGIGHSMVAAPDGEIIAEAGEAPEILYVDIDAEAVAQQRRRLPIL